jgi:hypothetical protein
MIRSKVAVAIVCVVLALGTLSGTANASTQTLHGTFLDDYASGRANQEPCPALWSESRG